ncbi:MAG: Gfo/Idh/MocA family oxidoreductase [Planctomycetales bacterium]|nr:Gfo/Idh/MocA family oxidoreductase [Planctomycetales bacterium]
MRRILVVGGGSIGERHVRCFQRAGEVEPTICDVSPAVRNRIAETYGLRGAFDDYSAALADGPDAVVICTPAHLHVAMARQAVAEGRPVLIEKPLSVATDGVDELRREAERGKVPVALAYVTRHHPALMAMRDAIHSGRFGEPVQLTVLSGQHFPFYRPAYREIYYTRHETGGGAIQDALTHMLNAAEWIGGPIRSVAVDAAHCVLEGVDVEDTVHLLARLGGGDESGGAGQGVLASFTLNQHQYVNETLLTVCCQRGVVRYEGHAARWLSCEQIGGEWREEQSFALERDDLFVAQAKAFLDVLDGDEPACGLADGIQTLKVNLAALQSARERRWVTVE